MTTCAAPILESISARHWAVAGSFLLAWLPTDRKICRLSQVSDARRPSVGRGENHASVYGYSFGVLSEATPDDVQAKCVPTILRQHYLHACHPIVLSSERWCRSYCFTVRSLLLLFLLRVDTHGPTLFRDGASDLSRTNRGPDALLSPQYPVIKCSLRRRFQQLHEVARRKLGYKSHRGCGDVLVHEVTPDENRKKFQTVSLLKPMMNFYEYESEDW
jgi:hypothetical protein